MNFVMKNEEEEKNDSSRAERSGENWRMAPLGHVIRRWRAQMRRKERPVLTHHGVGEGDAMLPQNGMEALDLKDQFDLLETRFLETEIRLRERIFMDSLSAEVRLRGEGRVRYLENEGPLTVEEAQAYLEGGLNFRHDFGWYRVLPRVREGRLEIGIYRIRGKAVAA